MTDTEDLKAKMREALDRKKEHHHPTAEGVEHDGSDKSHGAAESLDKPEFHRKSTHGGIRGTSGGST
ncbi:DUF5302 domain-containing protein [Aeromicrobium sp. 179-A 4D2 NHS]|uniref:DUF5302 domain-containing protein n=1 Tax=Aeromicrobium sp. 179-A 4D2 NHS TaxID=3142375 RepID=UPI0039A1BE2B